MAKHYVYGGGMSGCLFDYGPSFTESKQDAIDSLVELYTSDLCDDDLTAVKSIYNYIRTVDELETEMRSVFAVSDIYYFPSAIRGVVGADYCEISECEGECPNDE